MRACVRVCTEVEWVKSASPQGSEGKLKDETLTKEGERRRAVALSSTHLHESILPEYCGLLPTSHTVTAATEGWGKFD